jgi:hypothetical protein
MKGKVLKMEVKREFERNEKPMLELGDVIEWYSSLWDDCSYYLVMELQGKYVAKSFDGKGGLFGIYDSLQELNEAFIERGTYRNCTVYKPSEFYLAIKRK